MQVREMSRNPLVYALALLIATAFSGQGSGASDDQSARPAEAGGASPIVPVQGEAKPALPFIGNWRVVMVGLTDPKTGASKLSSPESRHYTFYIDRTGEITKGTISAMFSWTWDGKNLSLRFRDGGAETYSSVISASSNGGTSLGLTGEFDYNRDGHPMAVTMSLWKE
ncbi:MAG TPA: hypothetical protein VFL04_01145 [Rectinemataceae bacterium]|nr:hypothetical protein [Rectinemataceae bacterium]